MPWIIVFLAFVYIWLLPEPKKKRRSHKAKRHSEKHSRKQMRKPSSGRVYISPFVKREVRHYEESYLN
jgi:hypothetical protein